MKAVYVLDIFGLTESQGGEFYVNIKGNVELNSIEWNIGWRGNLDDVVFVVQRVVHFTVAWIWDGFCPIDGCKKHSINKSEPGAQIDTITFTPPIDPEQPHNYNVSSVPPWEMSVSELMAMVPPFDPSKYETIRKFTLASCPAPE